VLDLELNSDHIGHIVKLSCLFLILFCFYNILNVSLSGLIISFYNFFQK